MVVRVRNLFFYLLICPVLHASFKHQDTLTLYFNTTLQPSIISSLNLNTSFQPSSNSTPASKTKSQPTNSTSPFSSSMHFPNLWSSPPSLLSPKCCPPNYILSSSMNCITTLGEATIHQPEVMEHFVLQHPGLANCSRELEVVEITGEGNNSRTSEDPLYYCVENIFLGLGNIKQSLMVRIQCPTNDNWLALQNILDVFTGAGVVSLVSLLLIFLVYWYVPDFNTLHGSIVISNVVSITFVTLFLITVFNADLHGLPCTIIGYFGYFSSISMFSWMTIMCFDLSYTLIRYDFSPPDHSPLNIRFVAYSLVEWGSGILLMIWLLLLQLNIPEESDFNPLIGDQICFISSKGYKMLYLFHLPILIFMVLNISIFITIIIFLSRAKTETKEARVSRR